MTRTPEITEKQLATFQREVAQLVSKLFDQKKKTLKKDYGWTVPCYDKLPPGVVINRNRSLYEQNIELKSCLHKLWIGAGPKEREKLASFCVKTWGNINGNAPKTLRTYAKTSPSCLIALGVKGIASWSKVLSMHDPARYAIYDSRVSISLNNLIAAAGSNKNLFFPMPPRRGFTTRECLYKLINNRRELIINIIPKEMFYEIYLNVLSDVAKRHRSNILEVEMTLFAYATKFVR
jgi:hypothetical protein